VGGMGRKAHNGPMSKGADAPNMGHKS